MNRNYKVITLCGSTKFKDEFVRSETPDGVDAILVRSAVMHDMEFSPELKVKSLNHMAWMSPVMTKAEPSSRSLVVVSSVLG